jgi:penicillin-binding protein A
MRQLTALGLSLSALVAIAHRASKDRASDTASGGAAGGAVQAAFHLGSLVPPMVAPSIGPAATTPPAGNQLAVASNRREQPPSTNQPGAPAGLPLDPTLGVTLDLNRAVLRDGHYEIDLPDRRRAQLTLDPQLQSAAEKLLAETRAPRAAAIVMSTDGRILALAGRRTESPRGGKEGIADFHLATDVWAPAASIFKLVTATALMRAGVTPTQRVCFHGGLRSVLESNLTDSPRDNRCEDLSFAVAHSQNAIIAKLSHQHLSTASLTLAAHDLGVAGELQDNGLARCGGAIELPEQNGVDFAKAAAGFRGSHLSVLGGGLLANTFATRGVEVAPTIVAAVIDGEIVRPAPAGQRRRVLDAKIADAVADMMVGTCAEGSAAKSFRARESQLPKNLKVAGKTGTIAGVEPFPMEYSWFVGFAPADAPKLTVAVLVGNTDDWWLKGHTVARKLFEQALADQARAAKR